MMKMRSIPKRGHKQAGFTLVELMIVVGILGLLTSVVVLSLPGGSSTLDQDAQRFAARTAALRDNAILQSRPMAVQVTQSGYSFLQRSEGGWDVLEDKPFISTDWTDGITAIVGDTGTVLVYFESTGLPSDQATINLRYNTIERSISIAPMGDVKLVGTEQ